MIRTIKVIRVVCLMLLLLVCAGQSGLAEQDTKKLITVAGDSNFPPYEFVEDRDGFKVYRGFNIELIRAVIDKTDYEVQFLPMAWEDALRALDDGRVDAISGLKYGEERAVRYDFSEEYLINTLAIFVPKDNSIIAEIQDLSGKRVAVQKDDIAYQNLKGRDVDLIPCVSQQDAIQLLLEGKVEAVLGNKMAGQYALQRLGGMDAVKTVGGVINPERYGLAVLKGRTRLLEAFNDGLKKVKADGTYDNIYFKWFGEPVDYPANYYKKYLRYVVAGLVLATLLILIFLRLNYVLKRQVENRTREIRRVNEELMEKNRYIRDVNRMQSSVLNSRYGGVLVACEDGGILFANQYACEKLQLSGDPTAQNMRDTPSCSWLMGALRAGEASEEVPFGGQWFEYSVRKFESEERTADRIFHFREITQEKQLREEVVKRHKMEALGQLVASIAHEIRTPLTSIKTFVELLPAKYENPDFRDKISLFVPQEIERLNRVVNDLLTYANPPSVRKDRIPLKYLLDGVLVYFSDEISRENIEFTVNLDERDLVFVDGQQMKQVMINILLNAIQALQGVERPSLRIWTEKNGGASDLLVADNGQGMEPEALQRVFEPFYTTKAGGTGLGMFVSYQLARRNGVELLLESVPDEGTTVRLRFGEGIEVN